MRNRLFLLVLVAVILLVQAVLRTATLATPFSLDNTLFGVPYWELRGALPLGVFAAGLLLVSTAAAAQTAQAAFQAAGYRSRIAGNTGPIISAALWCGIPTMAACFGELPHIFPWLLEHNPTGWQTREHLEWALHGCPVLLVICRLLHAAKGAKPACFTLPAALLCLLSLGQFGFGHAFILIPAGIMGTAGFLMLQGRSRRWAFIPLMTAILMNGGLLWMTAGPVATIPPAIATYSATLLALATPFYLKITTQQA